MSPNLSISHFGAYDLSMNSAKHINIIAQSYLSTKAILKASIVVGIALVLIYPLSFIAGLWFKLMKYKIMKMEKKEKNTFDTIEEYVSFKEKMETFNKYTLTLNKISTVDIKKIPHPARFVFKQMKDVSLLLLKYNSNMNSRLDFYNKPQFKSKSDIFKFKSEKQMWESRNKAYKYWM